MVTEIIAEIGCNHQGDFETAKEMIKAAYFCKVSAIKAQKRTVKEYLTPEQYERPYNNPHSFGATYGQHREALEFSADQHKKLMRYAKHMAITYFVSVWDVTAAKEMNEIGIPIIKIPSACLTDDDLLEEVKSFGKPIYMSTGMSTIKEIDHAVDILNKTDLTLFHCTSCYPCRFEDVYLKNITFLRERYSLPVGLSGHHLGIAIDLAAAMIGATKIERHFTLDRTMKGTDHAASLEPQGLQKLVRDLKAVQASLKFWSRDKIVPCEKPSWEKLRMVK